MSVHIAIIGAGPAGIEAARAAATAGARVSLISDAPLGGRAGWHSLLPSKVWLAAADALGESQSSHALGLVHGAPAQIDPRAVTARIQQVAQAWNARQEADLIDLGVEMVSGTANFIGPNLLNIQPAEAVPYQIQADAIILAAGSVPIFPPDMRPDGRRILAPRFARRMEELPDSILVIGAGATGTEFTYLFNRLGLQVTWLVDQYGILPTFDPAAGHVIAETFQRRGVNLVQGQMVRRLTPGEDGVVATLTSGETVFAQKAFVGIGRRPDLSRLDLDRAGLELDGHGLLAIDSFCRTSVQSIYAVGDVASGPMVANRAVTQARIAGLHAAGAESGPYRPETVVQAIYCQPAVAQVGLVDPQAPETASVEIPYQASLKAGLLPQENGFLRLVYRRSDGRVLGGLAVGDHAPDVLAPLAVAIQLNAALSDLAAAGPAYPTLSELGFLAARQATTRAQF